ncbi:MAG: ABC transporter permease [Lachnospiraceae bacterium]|nr:ABC transporter permease [Lachnospiraceae bacterium]
MRRGHISLSKYMSIIILAVMMLISAVLDSSFLTGQNLVNILRQISIVTILAFGETMLIIGGQLDLSVGTNAAMSGTFACIVFIATGSLPVAVLTGMALGAVVGTVNGFVVTKFDAPPFIVTLAMQQITTGIIFLYTDGQNVYKIGDFRILGQGNLGFIPIPIIIMLIICAIVWMILKKMKFGRYLYAIGGNQSAAVASGIKVKSVLMRAYILSGVLAGLGGVILMSRLNAGLPASGAGMETDALMATIIGGTSFTGGIGTALGTLIGACVIGVLNNIMTLVGVQAYIQQILKGTLIICAVVIDIYSKKNKKVVRIVDDKVLESKS